jgi:hypothetical protein
MKKYSISLAASSLLLPLTAFAAESDTPTAVDPIAPSGDLDVAEVLTEIIWWVLGFSAAVAVLFLIIGGLLYITAAGNSDRAKTARQTILYAVIGLIVITLSFVIVALVSGTFNFIF